MQLNAPITGSVGEWAVAYFDSFGQFRSSIAHTYTNYFAMWIVATAEKRKKIATRLPGPKTGRSLNRRRHEKFVPRNPDSICALPMAVRCHVKSSIFDTGVAVSADTMWGFGRRYQGRKYHWPGDSPISRRLYRQISYRSEFSDDRKRLHKSVDVLAKFRRSKGD